MFKELEFFTYIFSIKELFYKRVKTLFEDEGLNSTEIMIIYLIQHKLRECKTSDLAMALYLPMSTMTGVIDKMVEKGIVLRENNPEDRRVIIIKLKPEFKAKAEHYMHDLEKTLQDITKNLDPEWLTDFTQKLKTFKEVLEK
ncbi:MAG: MarR family winged helix-turn-helix transcriptional regulator [Desulfitobacteriia bacterium]|jgi:DNA-binding MarR family transcriptional regulator